MTIACACLLTAFGAATIYLSHPQQGLLRTAMPGATRAIGTMAIIAGTWLWCVASGLAAGVAGALTNLMLVWVLLPYLTWWRGRKAAAVRTAKR